MMQHKMSSLGAFETPFFSLWFKVDSKMTNRKITFLGVQNQEMGTMYYF